MNAGMIMPIVQYGDAVLRKKCKPLTEVTAEHHKLAQDMIETMEDASGVGLAAPQVGIDLQFAVVDVSHDPDCISFLRINGEDIAPEDMPAHMPIVFYNPELQLLPPHESGQEGCLSIQGVQAKVNRPSIVKASLPQLDGSTMELEADGLLARAIQHEVDHLQGILFTDRLSSVGKARVATSLKRLTKRQRGW